MGDSVEQLMLGVVQLVGWVLGLVLGFIWFNRILTVCLGAVGALCGLRLWWPAGGVGAVALVGLCAWFWRWPESFDLSITTPWRKWWRRRRYSRAWNDLMVGRGLSVKDAKSRVLIPVVGRVRQGRFADALTVYLPAALTTEEFAEQLAAVAEAMHAREARMIPRPARRTPRWLASRRPVEFTPGKHQPGVVRLRLAYGDRLIEILTHADLVRPDLVDLSRLVIGRRDDGQDWMVGLLNTHILLTGATGAGKGSVLWSIIAALGPAIRAGFVQVVGIDPKGGMELGFGRELFRTLVTMDGTAAQGTVVEFLEELADEADRRASMLAGHVRVLNPSRDMPFILIVIDELASVVAFIADSKLRQRAEAALGRLLTKGRAPGMCVIGALQDPRKDIVKWRDLLPTRIAMRLVEAAQVDLALGDGSHDRGARCEAIPDTSPGVAYVTEEGSTTVIRVRAAYLTDDDIRGLVDKYRPGAGGGNAVLGVAS